MVIELVSRIATVIRSLLTFVAWRPGSRHKVAVDKRETSDGQIRLDGIFFLRGVTGEEILLLEEFHPALYKTNYAMCVPQFDLVHN